MNVEDIFKKAKESFKEEIFSEGEFKVVSDNSVIIKTESLLLNTGVIIPKDWDAFDFALESDENSKVVFENKNGQYPCFFYEVENCLLSIVPGIILLPSFESDMQQVVDSVENDDDLKAMGLEKEVWINYLQAKPDTKPKLKM